MSIIKTQITERLMGFYLRHPEFPTLYNYYRYACAPFKVRGVITKNSPETLASLGTQKTGRRQRNKKNKPHTQHEKLKIFILLYEKPNTVMKCALPSLMAKQY